MLYYSTHALVAARRCSDRAPQKLERLRAHTTAAGRSPDGGGLQAIYDKAFGWCAVRYQAAVARELRKYGLRYDDLLDEDADMVCALLPAV